MTLAEMQEQIWRFIGEPSDLYDDDTATYDSELTLAINEGLRQVATWRDPQTGRAVRYPALFGETFFQPYRETGTLDADGTTTTVVLPAGSSAVNDAYNGWTIEINSETRVIMDYVGSTLTATVNDAFDSAPATSDTYELTKNFIQLLASTHSLVGFHLSKPTGFLAPQRILNLTDSEELSRASRTETYISQGSEIGTPTEFYFKDDRLVFNFAFEEDSWLKMEYTRLPAELSASSDEPELPEYYHQGIVLWGRWWGYAREQALQEAYASKQDFVDFMRQRIGMYHFETDRENVYGVLRRN